MDKKISELTLATPGDNDVIPFTDVGTSVTYKALKSALKGEKGTNGAAATVDAGTTTTLAAGQSATVTNVGTTSAAIFNFAIPQGIQGVTGADGADGACVESVAFVGNDMVFTLDDSSTVTLTNAKTDLKGDTGAKITSASFVGDDLVFVLDDSSTVTVVGAKTDLKGDKGDTGDIGINWQGAWSAGTYTEHQGVAHNGSSWIATTTTTEEPSISATDWDLMAQKGSDGAGSGDVVGPATNTDSYIPQWDGADSKTLKNGLGLDTDLSSTSASDDTVPSAKATKAMGDLKLPLAGGTMTGDIQLGETDIKLDATLSADEKWSGIVISGTAGATLAVGDVCYLASSGKWLLNDGILDGTDTGFSKQLGICVLAGADTEPTEMLVYGKVRSAAFPAFTVGSPVYLSDTAGDLTVTQPSTTNFAIRKVGIALSAEELMWSPSPDYIVHI